MANYAQLISAMEAVIKQNGTGAITGLLLQNTLRAVIQELGAKCQFGGVATPKTNPGTPDYNVAFIASGGTYPNFDGIVVPGGNIAILSNTGENGSWESQTIQITVADNGITTAKLADNAVTTDKIADENVTRDKLSPALKAELNNKADIDGFYSTMGVGAAENLIGRGSVIAEFMFRTSGGSADIGSGLARIKKLMGKTIVFNQKVPIPASSITETKNGITLTDNRDGSYSVTTNYVEAETNFAIPNISDIPVGHKVLILGTPKQTNPRFYFRVNGNSESGNGLIFTNNTASITAQIHCVYTGQATTPLVFKPQIIDLTLMFGTGNEPSTVAEFKALFPYLFYPYNEGQLLSVTVTGLKTVGFNQYNPTTGKALLLGGHKYQVSGTYTDLSFNGSVPTLDGEGCFTPAVNGELIITGGNDTDTCVHLVWSGYRNGEYESYWDDTLPLPITTLTGKLNGVGESVVIFPDGLKSAGNVFDEITANGSIKRIGVVIGLEQMSWTKQELYPGVFSWYVILSGYAGNAGLTSNKFIGVRDYYVEQGFIDKIISYNNNRILRIFDEDFNDASATPEDFAQSLAGTVVYLPLKTPETYVLDNELIQNYRVDDFGTEIELPQNDDEPVTAPIRYEVQYAMNAVDTLRRLPENYISKESFIDFLAEFDSKIGAAIGATIVTTMTFDSESQKYGFDISVTPNNP